MRINKGIINWAVLCFIIVVVSCNSQTNKEKQKETSNQQADEGYIMKGKILAQTTASHLMSTLSQKISSSGYVAAVSYCNYAAIDIVDSLSKVYQAEITRKTLKPRNPSNYPDSLGVAVLEEYQRQTDANIPIGPIVKEHKAGTTFYAPIFTNQLCLNCHGKTTSDIQPETLQVIDSLYPNDKARGYGAEQLRGMWCITFRR